MTCISCHIFVFDSSLIQSWISHWLLLIFYVLLVSHGCHIILLIESYSSKNKELLNNYVIGQTVKWMKKFMQKIELLSISYNILHWWKIKLAKKIAFLVWCKVDIWSKYTMIMVMSSLKFMIGNFCSTCL